MKSQNVAVLDWWLQHFIQERPKYTTITLAIDMQLIRHRHAINKACCRIAELSLKSTSSKSGGNIFSTLSIIVEEWCIQVSC